MVLQEVVKIPLSHSLVQLVSATHSQEEKTLQIVGVSLVRALERENSLIVLIVLLEELSEQAPSFGVLLVLLDFSFETQDRLLNLLLFDKLFGSRK